MSDDNNAFLEERISNGEAIIDQNFCREVCQYVKQGCPTALRAKAGILSY